MDMDTGSGQQDGTEGAHVTAGATLHTCTGRAQLRAHQGRGCPQLGTGQQGRSGGHARRTHGSPTPSAEQGHQSSKREGIMANVKAFAAEGSTPRRRQQALPNDMSRRR